MITLSAGNLRGAVRRLGALSLAGALAILFAACSAGDADQPQRQPQPSNTQAAQPDDDQTQAGADQSDPEDDTTPQQEAAAPESSPDNADRDRDNAGAGPSGGTPAASQDGPGGVSLIDDPYADDGAAPNIDDEEEPGQDPREALTYGIALRPNDPPLAGDEYGWSASLDSGVIAVGAPLHDATAEDAGAVWVFELFGARGDGSGGEWVETAYLLPDFPEFRGWFGRWLAVNDGRLVVGAPYEDFPSANAENAVEDAGAAYVYERQEDGVWRRTATILPPRPLHQGQFGWSVAIDGDLLAVSAWGEPVDGVNLVGAVYIFREVKGDWMLEARVAPAEPQSVHQYGRDIELQRNVLVVGAPGDDLVNEDAGAIYIYHYFDDAWNFAGKYAPEGLSEGAVFGSQVSLDFPWIASGAHRHSHTIWREGGVYTFKYSDDDDRWYQQPMLQASDATTGDWFGYSTAVEGETLIIGAPHRLDPETALVRAGAAYIFRLVEGEWVEQGVIGPIDPQTAGENAEYGWAVDVEGNRVIVGSWLADTVEGADAGTATAFVIPSVGPGR